VEGLNTFAVIHQLTFMKEWMQGLSIYQMVCFAKLMREFGVAPKINSLLSTVVLPRLQ
jgi:hypothetical protein